MIFIGEEEKEMQIKTEKEQLYSKIQKDKIKS